MFSTFIRLGAALSCAAMLSSCGGNSVAETQQSTPEGIFTGTYNVTLTNQASGVTKTCTENVLSFVVITGSIYTFYPSSANPAVLNGADYGSMSYSAGAMSASMFGVISPASNPATAASYSFSPNNFSAMCDDFGANIASANLTGGYNTGQNIAGTLTYSGTDVGNNNNTTSFNLPYSAAYQGIQSLSTLAGTYNGYVSTSQFAEPASFTISPASVPANAGNDLGVSVLTGTGASGCAYTGSVSPLFKGNGYTVTVSTGAAPCLLPQTQFSGLIYLDTTNNIIYTFAPNSAHSDGVLFSGTRS